MLRKLSEQADPYQILHLFARKSRLDQRKYPLYRGVRLGWTLRGDTALRVRDSLFTLLRQA